MKLPSWPTVIISVVTAAFLAVVAFVFFSQRHKVDLVAPDYYAQSLRHQDRIDSVRRAAQLTPEPMLRVEQRSVQVAIPNPVGATGEVYFYRPSDGKLDQRLPLALDEAGRQTMDASALAGGFWKIELTWTVSNLAYRVETSAML